MAKSKKKKRIWLWVVLGIVAVLLLAVIGYVLYVMISYHRPVSYTHLTLPTTPYV